MTNQSKINDPRTWDKWRASGAVQTGEAYAFFNCSASKEELNSEIPAIREEAQIPGNLELTLTTTKELEKAENTDPRLLDYIRNNQMYSTFSENRRELKAVAQPYRMTDLTYVLKARYANKTNDEAAMQLGDAMNQVYRTHGNDEGDEVFTAEIVGKDENGEYGPWSND